MRLYPALYKGCKEFASVEEAYAWMSAVLEADDYYQYGRFKSAAIGDHRAFERFKKESAAGWFGGYFETRVRINGVPTMVCCSYE